MPPAHPGNPEGGARRSVPVATVLVTLAATEATSWIAGKVIGVDAAFLRHTLPLTLAAALISVVFVLVVVDDIENLGVGLVLVAAILALAGLVAGQLDDRGGPPEAQGYSGVAKVVMSGALSLGYFYERYEAATFFKSLLIGLAAPWVGLHLLRKKYKEAAQKVLEKGGGD